MKIAIVHDWLTGMRGGEKVLEALLKLYPEADLFTLLHNQKKCSLVIENRKITTSFINSLPFKKNKYRLYLPLFPLAIESLDLKPYDLVLSSSHCVAKGVISNPNAVHLSYIHSPMRYVWDLYYDYFPKNKSFKSVFYQIFSHYLRNWDVISASRVDRFIANSNFVAKRIKKYYRRDAKVVFPPCFEGDMEVIEHKKEDFYLIVSAFAPYKKIDLAIEAFRQNRKKLIILGDGQDKKKLLKNLPSNVTILSNQTKKQVSSFYQKAKALIFPGLEDFGIVPVEAQLNFTPVIAFAKGGVLDTVVNGKTGILFSEQTVNSINNAIDLSEKNNWQKSDFQKNILKFSEENFTNNIKREVDTLLKET